MKLRRVQGAAGGGAEKEQSADPSGSQRRMFCVKKHEMYSESS
jgi:hypothetical protein